MQHYPTILIWSQKAIVFFKHDFLLYHFFPPSFHPLGKHSSSQLYSFMCVRASVYVCHESWLLSTKGLFLPTWLTYAKHVRDQVPYSHCTNKLTTIFLRRNDQLNKVKYDLGRFLVLGLHSSGNPYSLTKTAILLMTLVYENIAHVHVWCDCARAHTHTSLSLSLSLYITSSLANSLDHLYLVWVLVLGNVLTNYMTLLSLYLWGPLFFSVYQFAVSLAHFKYPWFESW